MPTETKINQLVINKIESQEIYDYLSENNLINEDELYFVGEGEDETLNITLADLGVTATATELNYVDGVTSSIQNQLNSKLGKTEKANSASSADTASTLGNSDVGSVTQPIYLENGSPKTITYSLNKTVPADAVFTDTHYSSLNIIGRTASATTNTTSALTNGNVYLNHVEDGAVKSHHKITGAGDTTVTTDSSGNITISSTASTATSASKLSTTRYIDGVSFTGEANVTRYATSSTAAATAAKTASITAGTFSLITGARVTVKFSNANSATRPTLNVGSTGAKYIYWHGTYLASGQYWEAGAVLDFVYNGTQWELIGIAKDNGATYSAAGASLGLVQSGGDVTISSGTITVNDDSHNHTSATLSLPTATQTVAGITTLTNSVTSTSTTTAATPNSVKTVNDKVVTLEGLVSDSGWYTLTVPSGVTANQSVRYRKIGNIVYLQGSIAISSPTDNMLIANALPTGYRPTAGNVIVRCPTDSACVGQISIATSGAITLQWTRQLSNYTYSEGSLDITSNELTNGAISWLYINTYFFVD